MMDLKWFAIQMNLDAQGRGPANENETATREWQIWDESNCTVCSCKDQNIANYIVALHNSRI